MTDSNSNEPKQSNNPIVKSKQTAANKKAIGTKSTVAANDKTEVKPDTVLNEGGKPISMREMRTQTSPAKGLSVFAIILSLAALAGTAFTWYQNQVVDVQQESRLSLGVTEIGGQVSRLGDSISRIQQDQANLVTQADLGSKVLELQTAVSSDLQVLQDSQAALDDSINKINTNLNQGVDRYVVDEVSQLLRLANNSVLFRADAESAINALSLADSQLKSLSDPRYAAVRTKINQEISMLRDVQQVDIESLSAELHAIAETIPSLPLANEPEEIDITAPESADKTQLTWSTELRKFWRDILNSVQIQRVDQPPKPLLVPQQRYFLDQNIQLSIAKAELALLQGEGSVFVRSIEDSIKWLGDYFDLSDARVNAVLSQLEDISVQSTRNELPVITGSYQAIQNISGGQR